MTQSERSRRALEQNEPIGVTHDPVGAIGLADLASISHDSSEEVCRTSGKGEKRDLTEKSHNIMATLTPVACKLVSYVPFVLVLLDLRYEGKKVQISFPR